MIVIKAICSCEPVLLQTGLKVAEKTIIVSTNYDNLYSSLELVFVIIVTSFFVDIKMPVTTIGCKQELTLLKLKELVMVSHKK